MLLGTSLISNFNFSSYINILKNYFRNFANYMSSTHRNLLSNFGVSSTKDMFFGVVAHNVTTLTCADVV
jgi:hypothetical protein